MKNFITAGFLLLFVSLNIFAQKTERFDIVSYSAPDGWKKTGNADATFFTTEDTAKSIYCAITLFKAFPASADSKKNFDAAWSSLAADSFKLTSAPQMQPAASDNGWVIESGLAPFEKDGKKGVLMLITATGIGKMLNVLILTNTDAYQSQVSDFVGSINLPAGNSNPTQTPTETNVQTNIQAPTDTPNQTTPPPPMATNSTGITKSSTTFSDGWTAAIQSEYVLVTKGNLKVLLFYPAQITDQVRQAGVGEYFWKAYVQSLFNTSPPTVKRDDVSSIDYAGGNATDKSGKSIFVAMSVLRENGVARVVVATAPDKQTYEAQFPQPTNLGAMTNSNRFAVTPADLVGNWDGKRGNFSLMENIYTGQSAGMNAASLSDQFSFAGGGTYTSRHKAATGMVGSQKFSDVSLNGQFQATDWELTLTNRENGKTSVFTAYFEAIKGGKILHLTDRQYSSMQYHLYKTN